MNTTPALRIQGIPSSVPSDIVAVFRSRVFSAVDRLLTDAKLDGIEISVSTISQGTDTKTDKSQEIAKTKQQKADVLLSLQERALRYQSQKPLFNFEQLIVPREVLEDLLLAVDLVQLESKVFDEWGLREIEPFPRTALNFYGSPGTGKTLSAHAIASKINKPILVVSYAQVESMYHGEGSKNIEAVFEAAQRDSALLFIDEADSLLSKRLTNVTQGSEQAINSMRSQLLICLERFKGVVVFSTNLIENYDKAFETRVRNIHFPMPDTLCRKEIWRNHLPKKLPLSVDTSIDKLAEIDDVSGRDIKNAVIDAAMRVARQGREHLNIDDLLSSIARIKAARIQNLTLDEKRKIQKAVSSMSET